MASTVDLNKITEYDCTGSAETIAQIDELAQLIHTSKHCIVFTGAGISTSAKIPDFRGPQGVWTRQAQGRAAPACVALKQAQPTPCHEAIAELVRRGTVKYVVSQNIDGLHRRSGVPRDRLSELHGNTFLEVCWGCDHDEEHEDEVDGGVNGAGGTCTSCRTRVKHFCHCTGHRCSSCGAASMKDSIIHFGENLPQHALREAYAQADKADVCVVLGSSLTVSPANDIPRRVANNGGRLVIVNLQETELDELASLRIFAKSDATAQRLMAQLEELEATLPSVVSSSQPAVAPAWTLEVGNRHHTVTSDECPHYWDVFVRAPAMAERRVAKVVFHLHPTFTPSTLALETPSCTLSDGTVEYAVSRRG